MPEAFEPGRVVGIWALVALAILLGTLVAVGGTAAVPMAPGDGEGAGSALADRQDAGSPEIEVEQTTPGNRFLANETPSVVLDADGVEMAWTVRDYYGEIVASGTTTVDGETRVRLPVAAVGHYTLRVRPAAAGPGNTARTELSVLPADEFDGEDEFFAMSTKFGAGRDHAMMTTLERLGVAAVRDEHGWHDVERTRGEYEFSGPHRRGFMTELDERGFDRLFLSVYGNQHYADDGEWEGIFTFPDDAEHRAGYANYTRAVLREYPDLQHVEVWNEPNIESFSVGPAGQDPTAYARLLAATDEAVDAERSGVTVVGGSTTRNHTGTNQAPPNIDYQYWEGVYEAGGADHMDAVALHLYRRQPEGYEGDLERFDELTRTYTDGDTFPVWVTEFGWGTAPHMPGGNGEQFQARALVQSHVRLKAAGVERAYWYTQVDSPEPDPEWQVDDGNDQFGLLRGADNPLGEGVPKPSYPGYATMSRQLAGTEFQATSTDPVQQYRFAGEDGPVRVLWATQRRDLTVRTTRPVTITTMTGQAQRLQPVDGEVYVTVGPEPSYLAGSIEGIEAGAPVDLQAPVTSGTDGDLTATFDNDGQAERTLQHEIGGETVAVTAGPGERASEGLALPEAYGDRTAVAVDSLSVDGQVVGRIETPVGVPRAQFDDPAFLTGMTVETANEGRRAGFSEVNDVGTRHSAFEATSRAGVGCYESDVEAGQRGRTLFVDVSDDHAGQLGDSVPVTVRYFDDGSGTFGIKYVDGSGTGAATRGVELDGDGRWETHTFELDGAAFPTASGDIVANGGHDFEVTLEGSFIGRSDGDVCFESVTIGTEPTTAIDPADADGAGNDSDADGEGDQSGSSDGGADGLPGFGIRIALIALFAAVLLARRRWA